MEEYEIYIPVNERVSKIKELIINIIYELSDNVLLKDVPYSLIDPDTGHVYENSMIIRETDIRNTKRLVLYQKI